MKIEFNKSFQTTLKDLRNGNEERVKEICKEHKLPITYKILVVPCVVKGYRYGAVNIDNKFYVFSL